MLVFGALAAVGSFLLARRIARPIASLSAVVGRIVQEGDLTAPIDVDAQGDEVGELAEGFRRLLTHLRETTASLQRGTRVLGDAVAELTAAFMSFREAEVNSETSHGPA